MSGGRFDYWSLPDELSDAWQDHELDELVQDLFCNGEFSVRGYGGLLQSLDFWLSADIDEEGYREAVSRFKAKWMHRTPRNRVEFYQQKLQDYADRLKREMGEA